MNDKIGVIIPVYNTEKYLNRCIASVINQTFKRIDIILVDDGSPDNAGKVCDDWKEKDKRIHVIHQKNQGLSAARNAGLDFALSILKDDYIFFLDSDDWINRYALDILYKASTLNNRKLSLCNVSRVDVFSPDDTEWGDNPTKFSKIITARDLYIHNPTLATVSWGKLYSSSCFENIRFPVGKLHEDQFTTYKIIFSLSDLVFVSIPLYYYFTNPEGITNSEWSINRLNALEAMEEELIYFTNHNYDEILIKAHIRSYLYCLRSQLSSIDKTSGGKMYTKYRKYIVKTSKKLLIKYHSLHPVSIKEDSWIYEGAFPKLMMIYWKLFNKL